LKIEKDLSTVTDVMGSAQLELSYLMDSFPIISPIPLLGAIKGCHLV